MSFDEASGTGSFHRPFEVFIEQTVEASSEGNGNGIGVSNTAISRTLKQPGECASRTVSEQEHHGTA
jgi:hypothetical protein